MLLLLLLLLLFADCCLLFGVCFCFCFVLFLFLFVCLLLLLLLLLLLFLIDINSLAFWVVLLADPRRVVLFRTVLIRDCFLIYQDRTSFVVSHTVGGACHRTGNLQTITAIF